jgi:DNA-binding CsgD family transcriptional regulator
VHLVERHEELTVLHGLLAGCLEGTGGVAVVTGAVATGKTALLQRFAAQASGVGATFHGAVATRVESSLPLSAISQLLPGVEMAADVAGAVPDGGGVAEPVLAAICAALLDLAARRPIVIGVDDVQYADPQSRECLRYLVPRMRTARLLLVVNECASARQEWPPFATELAAEPHGRVIRLGLLSQAGVTAMLRQWLAPQEADRLARPAHDMTGGSPLLVEALLEDHRSQRRHRPAELVAGKNFGQAVLTCLYRGEPLTLELARAIAVLHEPATPSLVGDLLEVDPESAGRAASALNATGLLDGWRFRHEAAQAAVLDGMAPAERAALHARAAQMMHDRGAGAVVVARHTIAAHPVRAASLVPLLPEAAERALVDDDVSLAIDCLRVAYEACTNDHQRAALMSTLARAEWRVNPSAAARHLPELTAAVRAGRLKPRQAAVAIAHLLWHGLTDDAVEALDLIEQQYRATAPPKETAAIRRWLSYTYPCLLRPQGGTGREPDAEGATSLATVPTPGHADGAVADAEEVLADTRLDDATLAPIAAALMTLIDCGRLDRAGHWSDTLLDEAARRRAPTWRALIGALRATVDLRQGRLSGAERFARECLTMISPSCWGVVIGAPLSTLMLALIGQGKLNEAATQLTLPVPDAMFGTPFGLHYLQARGRYYLETGRLRAALADFQSCGDLVTKWGPGLFSLVGWRTDAAEVYLSMGNLRSARQLVVEQLGEVRPEQIRDRGLALRVLAATSGHEQRIELLDRAIGLLSECGGRLELAVTLADLSATLRDLGNLRPARVAAWRALRLAEQCGAGPLRQRLTEALGELQREVRLRRRADPGTIGELSEAELRVAALAVEGYTNREIAKKLYITVSTVEQHLTRVYRKLKVRRRTDLPAELRDHWDDAEVAHTLTAVPGHGGPSSRPRTAAPGA